MPRRGPVGALTGGLLDLPSADLTARVLSALLHSGSTLRDRSIRDGFRSIVRLQSHNGGWWCRWWAGFISGTTFVLDAFAAAGFRWGDAREWCGRQGRRFHASMERGVQFLLNHQNQDGGWGETERADTDPAWAGRGPSRPMQTAVSLHSLVRCGYPVSSREVRRGICWLLDAADSRGHWHDHQVTYTVIPGTLYYPHPLYTTTLLPVALSAFLKAHCDPRNLESVTRSREEYDLEAMRIEGGR
jgi:squalene-hopene/tetraprenyl-beta-curcumene cyclase